MHLRFEPPPANRLGGLGHVDQKFDQFNSTSGAKCLNYGRIALFQGSVGSSFLAVGTPAEDPNNFGGTPCCTPAENPNNFGGTPCRTPAATPAENPNNFGGTPATPLLPAPAAALATPVPTPCLHAINSVHGTPVASLQHPCPRPPPLL